MYDDKFIGLNFETPHTFWPEYVEIRVLDDINNTYMTTDFDEAQRYCDDLNYLNETCLEGDGQYINDEYDTIYSFYNWDDDKYFKEHKFRVVKLILEEVRFTDIILEDI